MPWKNTHVLRKRLEGSAGWKAALLHVCMYVCMLLIASAHKRHCMKPLPSNPSIGCEGREPHFTFPLGCPTPIFPLHTAFSLHIEHLHQAASLPNRCCVKWAAATKVPWRKQSPPPPAATRYPITSSLSFVYSALFESLDDGGS